MLQMMDRLRISGLRRRASWTQLDPHSPVLGELGNLRTRLARSIAEIHAAQSIRYQVFYREMSARPGAMARLTQRDRDEWDALCDHLLVIDTSQDRQRIVGTYRMLRGVTARAQRTGYYSQSEFDVGSLIARHENLEFMELGRSCVLPKWRGKRTIELLWHGTWAYVLEHGIDVMVGCASFAGTDPDDHAEALSFLYHHCAPDPDWDVEAVSADTVRMDRIGKNEINMKRSLAALPPLIKGYLRLGAWIGREAVIDRQFCTTDVLIILPVSRINPRYVNYYGADAGRRAA